jgi:hypothetical protein
MRRYCSQVRGDPILPIRQQVLDKIANHIGHLLGMKDAASDGIEQHDKRNKRKNRVGCHAERKRMHFTVEEIMQQNLAIPAPLKTINGQGALVSCPLQLRGGRLCHQLNFLAILLWRGRNSCSLG